MSRSLGRPSIHTGAPKWMLRDDGKFFLGMDFGTRRLTDDALLKEAVKKKMAEK